jgi:hypothetical protein
VSEFRIEHDLAVAASAERVWQVIVDLERYGEWNPFVVACRSSLVVGEPIEMHVRVLPWFAQPQRETIFEHEAGRRLCYGVSGGALGALASRRCHEVTATGPARARYVSRFALSGPLMPLVRGLLGGRLRAGFSAMSLAIQRRAET